MRRTDKPGAWINEVAGQLVHSKAQVLLLRDSPSPQSSPIEGEEGDAESQDGGHLVGFELPDVISDGNHAELCYAISLPRVANNSLTRRVRVCQLVR